MGKEAECGGSVWNPCACGIGTWEGGGRVADVGLGAVEYPFNPS